MRTVILIGILYALHGPAALAQLRESATVLPRASADMLRPSSVGPPQRVITLTVPWQGCQDDRIRGRSDASVMHGTTGWMLGGFASGLVLGLIGTGVITAVAATGSPQPDLVPDTTDPSCYREGYSGKARSKNTVSALAGGLVGTAVWVVIVVSATS